MRTRSLKGKDLYFIKGGDGQNCPLCGSPTSSCAAGQYCSKNRCGWVDGIAWLTKKQAKKYKDKIMSDY